MVELKNRSGGLARAQGVMRTEGADRAASRLLAIVLILVLYYLSYRYPLQINSSLTSPSYSDTPAALQATKYALYAALAAAVALYFAVSRSRVIFERVPVPSGIVLATIVVTLWPVTQAVLFQRSDLIETGIFFLVPAIMLLAAPSIDVLPLRRILMAFVVVAVLVNIVQIALYLVEGRLPALAYAGTISIRFGSLWDDPNGFAVAIAYLLPIAAGAFRVLRVPLVILLLGSLVISQSVTGAVATVAAVIIVWILQLRISSAWIPAFLVVVFASLALRLSTLTSNPVVESFIQGKAGSVQGHLAALTVLEELRPEQLLGFSPTTELVESGYVDMLGTEGLVFSVIYVGLLIALAVRALRNARAGEAGALARPVHYASATLAVAMLIALVNLPVQSVFPLNALLAVSLIVEFCTRPRSETPV